MIVTRSWLNEFVDLSNVSNEKLYETFNAIGLEVDSIKQIEIAPKVVVGKILSCKKHPDADKLNVCQIDLGSGTRQIVCGAANVLEAEYVAVATIGAVLPGDFEIKHAKLRGVESEGMVCASSELGLPDMGKGIMILDESIGKLEAGKELSSYEKIADTIIELELTANRGDCLSVYGVARDLSTALDIDIIPFAYTQKDKIKIGIARVVELRSEGKIDADIYYKRANVKSYSSNFLLCLRLAIVSVEAEGSLASILAYVVHTTGVILRAYDSRAFVHDEDKILINVVSAAKGITEVLGKSKVCSVVGLNQTKEVMANDSTEQLLFEVSYVNPDTLVEAASTTSLSRDELYYKTSRGSNPNLNFGFSLLASILDFYADSICYEGSLTIEAETEHKTIVVSASEISNIIGINIEIGKIVMILQKLGFKINSIDHNTVAVVVPLFRHDIGHIQDIAEEIVRIVGIDNIEAKPLIFLEMLHLNDTTDRYRVKKGFRHRAVGRGFYENISYVFSEKSVLEKYGFATTEEALVLSNPIAEDLNTLRSTTLVNLLSAVKRNINYTKKSIPLFEIGAVFGAKREQSEVLSFIFSGQVEGENVSNYGKPSVIDFSSFTQKVGAVIGAFELLPCTYENGLIHPYQSANIIIGGKVCGFLTKLHPVVQDEYGIPETFLAELDFDMLLPKHINVKPISKFQGVYKDLSVVIDKSMHYYKVAKAVNTLNLSMLQDMYPVDIYEDEKLADKKSLTIRFFIQSVEKTLEDNDIEAVMSQIMTILEVECKAQLR